MEYSGVARYDLRIIIKLSLHGHSNMFNCRHVIIYLCPLRLFEDWTLPLFLQQGFSFTCFAFYAFALFLTWLFFCRWNTLSRNDQMRHFPRFLQILLRKYAQPAIVRLIYYVFIHGGRSWSKRLMIVICRLCFFCYCY